MEADFTGVFQPVYTVRLAPNEPVKSDWIPKGESPAMLSLVLRDHAGLTPSLATQADNGAILVLHMQWKEAREIYTAITELAQKMDLPLPK